MRGLRKAMTDGPDRLRYTVARALAVSGYSEGIPILLKLTSGEKRVGYSDSETLEQMLSDHPDPVWTPALLELLTHPYLAVQGAAANVLGRMGTVLKIGHDSNGSLDGVNFPVDENFQLSIRESRVYHLVLSSQSFAD